MARKKNSKRVAQAANPVGLTGTGRDFLSAQFGQRVKWGILPSSEEEKYFMKSARSDYGRAVDIRIPLGYHAQVKKSWEMYNTDRIFRYLVDRCGDFGANGFEWELPIIKSAGLWHKVKSRFIGKKQTQEDKEKKLWDKWAAKINFGVPNVIPGIDEINKWMFKHTLLSAMNPLEWEWGPMDIDGTTYEVPVRMTIHNPLSIALVRKDTRFVSEEAWLKISTKKVLDETPTMSDVSMYNNPVAGQGWIKLNLMGINGKKSKQEAFIVKYNWTPGDNTALVYGRNVSVGQGLYPAPPFVGLYETLITRRALSAADLAILDGIINYILDWEIGDNTKIKSNTGSEKLVNQPRPAKKDSSGTVIEESSIDLAKKIITTDTRGPVMQLFHPYYIKLDIKMPAIDALINNSKYEHTTMELFQAFGVFIAQNSRREMDISTANFEQMLDNIRLNHIKRFWETLCTQIVNRNKDKLSTIPNMIFNPLNTKNKYVRD